MKYPDGFKNLVSLMEKNPVPLAEGMDLWNKFCNVVFIGKAGSSAEIAFIQNILKKQLDYSFVSETDGDDWEENVSNLLKERQKRIRDEEIQLLISNILKNLFYIMASLKAGARFFKRKEIFDNINELTKTKEKTQEFIEEMKNDKDLAGIGLTKAVLWLQSTGRGKDLVPPTIHLKGFLNSDIGPYYQYYDDNDYFIDKAQEMKKDFRASMMNICRAIFYYRSFKKILPRGNKLTPKKLIVFMKKEKINVHDLSEILSDMEKKEDLVEKLYAFMGYSV